MSTCKDCAYFVEDDQRVDAPKKTFGVCYYYPPTMMNERTSIRPLVKGTDFCSKHKRRID